MDLMNNNQFMTDYNENPFKDAWNDFSWGCAAVCDFLSCDQETSEIELYKELLYPIAYIVYGEDNNDYKIYSIDLRINDLNKIHKKINKDFL